MSLQSFVWCLFIFNLSFIAIVNRKIDKTINYFQLNFETTPKLRWVPESDHLLSKSMIDNFLAIKNAYGANACNSAISKLQCFN